MDTLKREPLDKARDVAMCGAAWLDTVSPGWDDRIDLTRLDLENPQNCILGQLYGTFEDGCKRHGLTSEAASRLGLLHSHLTGEWFEFSVYTCERGHMHAGVDGAREWTHDDLTNAWREVIQDRRCETRGRIVVDSAGTAEMMEGKETQLV